MKKNVIFWVGVKNKHYSEKYGGWEWMDISRKTWEYWCKKHDIIFFPFEEPMFGCTDLLACNYDPVASDDDGTCLQFD